MAKGTGPTNTTLQQLVRDLQKTGAKEKAAIWKRIAKDLQKPTRQRREVNITRINQHTKPKETIVVPGKVLGTGDLKHEVTVAAWQFSEAAKKKLNKTMTIQELIKQNPKGKNVRIIG